MPREPESRPLALVDPTSTAISPPRKLGQHGLNLWNGIQADYQIEDPGVVEMLAQACTALDRAEELAEQISKDGLVVQTRNGPRRHPALRDELAYRSFITRTLERLGLNLEPLGRPGRAAGVAWSRPSHGDE
jgi:Phage terminase, small subunit